MNKPVTFVCASIAGIGLLILALCAYYTLAYGNLEAGNFHRCVYWSERDPASGKMVKQWDVNWERVEGTEASLFGQVDLWFVGLGLVALGAVVWVGEWEGRHPRRSDS